MRLSVAVSMISFISFNAFAVQEMKVVLKPDSSAVAKEGKSETPEILVENQLPSVEAEAAEKTPDVDCRSLASDLKAMREAQSFMLNSMVRKNNSLAETLDLFAKDFSAKHGRLKKMDFQKMKKSADAFRGHADRERGLVNRFESSADQLVERVQKCLDASPIASQTSEPRSQN